MARLNPADLQRRMLVFILHFLSEHQYAPTINEVAEGTSVSRETVRLHLAKLEARGAITQGDMPRMLTVVHGSEDVIAALMDTEHEGIVAEASRRLSALMPSLPPSRLAEVAEAVAKAVERHNATE